MRAALLLLALVACSDRKTPPAASTSVALEKKLVIPSSTKQLVIAVIDDWSSTHARVSLWQRKQAWQKLDEWPATIGKSGAAWGIGLHPLRAKGSALGEAASAGARDAPIKREGDGKSPAGVFAFRSTYGYADEAPKAWRMPYDSAVDLECINDPSSDHYAQIIDRKQVPSDWQSAELMRREDELYEWVVDIAHNPDAKPSAGSCIFLHVWGGPESPTLGCTAMAKPKLEALLAKLDPANQPLFVLLPRAEYQAVADAWGLPAL